MNIISKKLEEYKMARDLKKMQKIEKLVRENDRALGERVKAANSEFFDVANKITDLMFDGTGFVIMTTKLVVEENGDEKLKHEAIVSKGFNISDLSTSCKEYTRLADNIAKTHLEQLEATEATEKLDEKSDK